MANFTQNISGTINCFGIQPSSKWGAPMAWSQDGWGYGSYTTSHFVVPIAVIARNSDTGPIFTDTYSNQFKIGPYVNTAAFLQNAIRESLTDGSGHYFYILPGGVTNDENAVIASYASATRPSKSWALSTTSTVSWVTG